MIDIKRLSHTYPGNKAQKPRRAIRALDLRIAGGEFCILSGPNGSGKSTLFKILCGLLRPSSGEAAIGGKDVFADAAAARALLGVVFQSPAVDKHLSVRENLAIHGELHGVAGALFRERAEEALAWTDLKNRTGDKVETLSGGLQRQVELAKCLIARPQVLILDEPTTGLDPSSRRNFLDALKKIQRERGMTVLMTSHIFSEAEDSDRVAIMRNGELLAYDSPAKLRALLGHEVVVIHATDSAELERRLAGDADLPKARRYGEELRMEDVDAKSSLVVLEKVLGRHRPLIVSISIKQPGLEDVFVHITGKAAESEAGAAEGTAP